ncbi:hypothetical protein vseg_018855 [Gypsophila vaccaria]
MFVQTHPSHGIVLGLSLLTKLATAQQSEPSRDLSLPPPPPPYSFSPPMATAVIILIIFFFTIGFLSVYIRHFMLCLGISLGRGPDGGNQGWTRDRQPRGLDPTKVDTFPTFLYSDVKSHRIGKSTLECAICLNEFADVDILRMLPTCCHVFHPHCIGPWLNSNVTCPVCRANLEFYSNNDSNKSFDYLASQLGHSSEDDESEPSNHNHDVIVRLGASPKNNIIIKSPVALQEIKRADNLIRKLPRSHSTGHSLVENCERYTLRLPDEVRNKLMYNYNLIGLPAAIISPRVGYRVGCTKIGGVKPDHWRFSVSPPFILRSGSTKSPKSDSENNSGHGNDNFGGIMSGPKNLFKSIKLPISRASRSDDVGERSTNRLWDNRKPHDLELEAQWHQNQ